MWKKHKHKYSCREAPILALVQVTQFQESIPLSGLQLLAESEYLFWKDIKFWVKGFQRWQ